MKKFRILVTWGLMIDYLIKNKSLLRNKKVKFVFLKTKYYLKEKELKNIIHQYDGLICGDDEINKNILDLGKNLKVIAKWGTGVDSINVNYAKKRGIKVFNVPNAFSDSVAQLALSFILVFSRRVVETHEAVKNGEWPKFSGFSLKDKTLGIIGFGNIGRKLANLALMFNMKIIFYDIKKTKLPINKKKKIISTSKNNLLKKSDIVVLCCNLNKTSFKLIKMRDLKLMKNHAGIISVARGFIINEKDLVKALKKKIISFAALDVFEQEPLRKSSPLKSIKNCVLSSHNAFNTVGQVNDVNIKVLKNLFKGLKIKKLINEKKSNKKL